MITEFNKLIPWMQIKEEFNWLITKLNDYQHNVILEIGTAYGGTADQFIRKLQPELMISIDVVGENTLPYENYIYVNGNSHKNDTLNAVIQKLNGKAVDVLFIDGDHSYDGVKRDFEMYSQLCRSNGCVAFHDILDCDFHKNLGCYVSQFWTEIRPKYKTEEISISHWGGIGLLILP